MQDVIERANQIKKDLVDFVYDAEGELAVSLEKYAAEQGKNKHQDLKQQNLMIDRFMIEGKVSDKTPLEMFLEQEPTLTPSDRVLLSSWQRSFMGLFEIIQLFPDGVEVINWLTAKSYRVLLGEENPGTEILRRQPREIVVTRIAPINEKNDYWLFLSDIILKGKLGKPKLAVAIGEFKQNYRNSLYGDAPELLALAWESVAQYHQEFIDFFGSDRIALPGYQLNRQINELQARMNQKHLAQAGIDGSKSLQEIIQDVGEDEADIVAAAEEISADSKELAEAIKKQEKVSLQMPKTDLPEEIKKAEMVTAFSHPKWGQMLIPTYSRFQAMLAAEEPQNYPNSEKLVYQYLEDPQINFFLWQQLQQQYSSQLEKLLQVILKNPDFNLTRDLGTTLAKFNKPLEPELPEIASVPQHLHDLFAAAFIQVNKSQSKSKKIVRKKKGFQV
ncbi:MAG: hypothetical protein RLZZ74_2123 [Cyanobacteriota bacterium]